jgi:hypothetical protein
MLLACSSYYIEVSRRDTSSNRSTFSLSGEAMFYNPLAFRARFTVTLLYLCGVAVLLMVIVNGAKAQTVKNSADGHTPSGLAPGASAGSYALSGFDNINFATGSLNFSLPLLTVGGRGSARYTMMLPIERHWSVQGQGHLESCGGSQICHYWDYYYPDSTMGGKPKPGFGPGILLGRQTGIYTTSCTNTTQNFGTTLTLLTFTLPDGSEIELRDRARSSSQ